MSANKTTVKRWVGVGALALGVAVALHLILPWGWEALKKIPTPPSVNVVAIRAALWLAWFAVGWAIASVAPLKWSHLRLVHLYPPFGIAVPVGVALAALAHLSVQPLRLTDLLMTELWPLRLAHLVSGVASGWLLKVTLGSVRVGPGQSRAALPDTGEISWPVLQRWVKTETESSDDLFGHLAIAKRFATVLGDSSPHHRQSAVLAGAWGSGKSTALRWVDALLDVGSPGGVWTCWITCWGIDDSRLLAAHVLRRAVEEIDKRVDASSLRGIPDAYLKALGTTRLGFVEGLLRPDGEDDVLTRIQGIGLILEAVDARLVLVIEDGDRAAGQGFDPGHLERLVSRLRTVDRVSVVLALDTSRASFDLTKLTEHLEVLPPLDTERVRLILATTRTHCLEAFDIARPLRGEESDRLDLKVSNDGGLLQYVRSRHDSDVCRSATAVIETPRRLKHVIRRVLRVWENLHGEVDIDDLIILCIIRECCPTVLRFLLDNIDPLRSKADDFNKRPDVAKQRWENLVATDPEAARAAPLVAILGLTQIGISTGGDVPQGVRHDSPIDYFRRIFAEELAADETSDQAVLSDISHWVTSGDDAMVRRLLSTTGPADSYVSRWEYFAWRIPNEKFQDLFEAIIGGYLTRVSLDGRWEEPLAFFSLWREHNRRYIPPPVPPATVASMIARVVPESLTMANDLYYYWPSPRVGRYSAGERNDMRHAMISAAKASLVNKEALLRALRFDPEGWALLALMFPADQDEPRSVVVEPAEWNWLAGTIIDALQASPEVMGLQVVRLIGDSSSGSTVDGVRPSYRLNRERIDAMFGASRDDLLRLISTLPLGDPANVTVAEARRQCQEWLDAPTGGA